MHLQTSMHECPDPNCSCVFIHEQNLRGHFYADVIHTSRWKRYKSMNNWIPPEERSTKQTTQDSILRHVQQVEFLRVQVQETTLSPGLVNVNNVTSASSKYFLYGFAFKRSGSKAKRSEGQLKFIRAWISQGVGTNATKISPDNACEMMKVYGTKEGQERFRSKFMSASSNNKPIFKYIERLSSYQLKAYASCSLTKLDGMIAKASGVTNIDLIDRGGRR